MKTYKAGSTRERGIYEIVDTDTEEKVDYSTSELLDEVNYELKQAKQATKAKPANGEISFTIDYVENKGYTLEFGPYDSYAFKTKWGLKRYLKDKLKSMDGGPKGRWYVKAGMLVVAFLLMFAAYTLRCLTSNNSIGKALALGAIVGVITLLICMVVFAITSSLYNKRLTILPLTIIKRKKHVKKSELEITLDFLIFTATTVAVSEVVKKLIGAFSSVQKFNEAIPEVLLIIAVVFLAILYYANALSDFLRTISRFVKLGDNILKKDGAKDNEN